MGGGEPSTSYTSTQKEMLEDDAGAYNLGEWAGEAYGDGGEYGYLDDPEMYAGYATPGDGEYWTPGDENIGENAGGVTPGAVGQGEGGVATMTPGYGALTQIDHLGAAGDQMVTPGGLYTPGGLPEGGATPGAFEEGATTPG